MTGTNTRTLKAFDEEFERLRARIAEMGGMAEAALDQASRALAGRDAALAAAVVEGDRRIDALQEETEQDAVRLIALYAPVAEDLREVVAALKIAGIIERIGDYAKNIARRVPAIADEGAGDPLHPDHGDHGAVLPAMAAVAADMVRDALDAFAARDAARAILVVRRDDVVDAFHKSIFETALAFMAENRPGIPPATHLLHMARSLERIADHATNIAGLVHFAVTGRRVEERSPPMETGR